MKKEGIFKIVGGIAVLIIIVFLGIYIYQPDKAGEVNIETEKKEYQIGEALKVKIGNNFRENICFSSCYPYYFEKKDGEWISYHYENCPDGDLVETCIEPKRVKAYEIIIPALKTGFHRLALPACIGCGIQQKFQEDQWLYSNDFVIK